MAFELNKSPMMPFDVIQGNLKFPLSSSHWYHADLPAFGCCALNSPVLFIGSRDCSMGACALQHPRMVYNVCDDFSAAKSCSLYTVAVYFLQCNFVTCQ